MTETKRVFVRCRQTLASQRWFMEATVVGEVYPWRHRSTDMSHQPDVDHMRRWAMGLGPVDPSMEVTVVGPDWEPTEGNAAPEPEIGYVIELHDDAYEIKYNHYDSKVTIIGNGKALVLTPEDLVALAKSRGV